MNTGVRALRRLPWLHTCGSTAHQKQSRPTSSRPAGRPSQRSDHETSKRKRAARAQTAQTPSSRPGQQKEAPHNPKRGKGCGSTKTCEGGTSGRGGAGGQDLRTDMQGPVFWLIAHLRFPRRLWPRAGKWQPSTQLAHRERKDRAPEHSVDSTMPGPRAPPTSQRQVPSGWPKDLELGPGQQAQEAPQGESWEAGTLLRSLGIHQGPQAPRGETGAAASEPKALQTSGGPSASRQKGSEKTSKGAWPSPSSRPRQTGGLDHDLGRRQAKQGPGSTSLTQAPAAKGSHERKSPT